MHCEIHKPAHNRTHVQKGTAKNGLTLWDAAKIYVVYLRSLRITFVSYRGRLRSLRHILRFYGYSFPLKNFDGKRVLQYADIYSPFDDDPFYRDYGRSYWTFIHWMKKNLMIPAWTAKEVKYVV